MQQGHGTWGRRWVTRITDTSCTAILYLKPGKRCSWHSHKYSFNQFFVVLGELWVKTDIGPDNQRNVTRIGPEQSFTVPPGVTHEFRTGQVETVIEEISYVEYDKHDIDRKLLGGNISEPGVIFGKITGTWVEPKPEFAPSIRNKRLILEGKDGD
jgi:mannose-6-phosphate isomerase-like protein (cupin superfamily)